MSTQPLKPGWKLVKFGDVVRQCKESVDRENNSFERYVEGGHIDSENIHIRRWGAFGSDYVGPAFHRIFRKGQVLYGSRRTYLKKVALAEFDGITANTTFVCETRDQAVFLQELLPFLMLTDSFTEHSIRESKGSTNPYINWPDIAKYEFPLPPIEEQKRIAEILWAADEVLETHNTVLARFQKGEYLLAHRLIPVSRLNIFTGKLRQSISPDFAVVQGEYLFTAQSGNGEPSPADNSGGDSLFFKVADFNRNAEETDLSDAEISFSKGSNTHIRLFEPGTVIFPKRGATIFLNKVGRLGRTAALDPNLMALVPRTSRCVSGYLYWAIKLIQLHRVSETTSLPQLNHKHLMPLWMPVPSLDKQEQIVRQLDELRDLRNLLQNYVAECAAINKQLLEACIGAGHV